jgi:hypothetical protein
MAWVKTLPCLLASGVPPFGDLWRGPPPDRCARPVEAHHAGVHGMSQKAPDDTVIPLCDHHHDCLTDRRGVFAGWPRHAIKLWELAAVEWVQVVFSGRFDPGDQPF